MKVNSLFILLIVLISAEVTESQNIEKEEVNPNLFIFYYNWYGNPEHNGRYHHWAHSVLKADDADTTTASLPGGKNIASNFYPSLGNYSNTDTLILQKHMKMIRKAGIGNIVLTWWQKDDFMDKNVRLIMDAAAKQGIKVCFHIEPFPGRNGQTTKAAIKYIIDNYSQHASFYRSAKHDNKPFFFIYDSYLSTASEWATIFNPKGRISIRDSRYDAVFIGLWVKEKEHDFFRDSGFDGFYTYFASSGFTYGSNPANWPGLQKWAEENNKIFIPCVGPGYIDERIRPWNAITTKSRESGKYYDRMFLSAIKSKAPYIGITSFNEWHEGTQIEPAIPFNSGTFQYLNYLPKDPDYYLNRTKYWSEIFNPN